MLKAQNRETHQLLFSRYANLYGAIEELWLPFPAQFREYFSKIGYSILPQRFSSPSSVIS